MIHAPQPGQPGVTLAESVEMAREIGIICSAILIAVWHMLAILLALATLRRDLENNPHQPAPLLLWAPPYDNTNAPRFLATAGTSSKFG